MIYLFSIDRGRNKIDPGAQTQAYEDDADILGMIDACLDSEYQLYQIIFAFFI